MPGVANSTMKCPSFAERVPAISFSPVLRHPILPLRPGSLPVPNLHVRRRQPLAHEIAADDRLLATSGSLAPLKCA